MYIMDERDAAFWRTAVWLLIFGNVAQATAIVYMLFK